MSLSQTIRAVVFDLDGTLVDSMRGFAQIAASVMARHHGCEPGWAHQQYLASSGLPFRFQLEKIFPGDKRNEGANRDFDEGKRRAYRHCPLFGDAVPTLKWLKGKGWRLAVSSNNDALLLAEKIRPLNGTIDCSAGFRPGFLKGDDHFRWIEEELKIKRTEMVFVGDSLHDAVMASENGVSFIGKAGTFSADDFSDQGIAIATIDCLAGLQTTLPLTPYAIRNT